jgi:ribosomal protein L37AE/L43A
VSYAGKWGCLSAVVVGGVGLVLFGLGFNSHTTEAMPFGAILTGVGLFIGVPSLQALRSVVQPGSRPVGKRLYFSMLLFCVGLGLVGFGAQRKTQEAMPFGIVTVLVAVGLFGVSLRARESVALPGQTGLRADVERSFGVVDHEPPASVRCENCGSPAPLRLAEPAHATCAHCGTRFALPAGLAAVMRAADLVVRAQGAAEKRISAILKSLPEKHVGWRARLLRISGGLTAIAAMTALFGWTRRNVDDHWFDYVMFGLAGGLVATVLGRSLARLVPRVAEGIVGHWAALQVPGVAGLLCRVCGAGLPSVAAPVLKCEYCAAESLAGPSVQALVAKQAGHAVRSVLSVTQRDARVDELAAFSMVAFPVVTLVGWFAVGALAGSAMGNPLSEVHFGAASLDFAVLRVVRGGSPSVCAAAVLPRGGPVELKFSGDVSVQVQPSELLQYAVEPNVNAAWFVGHRVNGLGKIDEVYSLLRSPHRVEASQGPGLTLYFPYDGLGGEFICLDDVPTDGAALKL